MPKGLLSFLFPATFLQVAIMKFSIAAAVAATAGLAAASPVITQVRAEDLKVSTLGGATFRVRTVYNKDYSPVGKGPRALGRVYQKYGIEMSSGLISTLEEIAQKMSVRTHFSSASRRRDTDNTTVGAGKGIYLPLHHRVQDIEYALITKDRRGRRPPREV